MLREALGAIAALKQERLAGRDLSQGTLQLARLAGEDERRETGQLLLDGPQCGRIRVSRNLLDGVAPPTVGRPALAHRLLPMLRALSRRGPFNQARLIRGMDGNGESALAANPPSDRGLCPTPLAGDAAPLYRSSAGPHRPEAIMGGLRRSWEGEDGCGRQDCAGDGGGCRNRQGGFVGARSRRVGGRAGGAPPGTAPWRRGGKIPPLARG